MYCHVETSQLIFGSNRWTGFFMIIYNFWGMAKKDLKILSMQLLTRGHKELHLKFCGGPSQAFVILMKDWFVHELNFFQSPNYYSKLCTKLCSALKVISPRIQVVTLLILARLYFGYVLFTYLKSFYRHANFSFFFIFLPKQITRVWVSPGIRPQ